MAVIKEPIQYTVGIEDLFICFEASKDPSTNEPTYEPDVYQQTNITDVTFTPNTSTFSKWASNKKIINIVKTGSYGLGFNLAGLSRIVRDKMFGNEVNRGVAFEKATPKEYPKFAIGIVAPLSDGNKLLRWYPGCSITPSEKTLATITEEMTVNDVAYSITADALLFNDITVVELDTGREGANITATQFMNQVVYDESQLETLFPSDPLVTVMPDTAIVAPGGTRQLSVTVSSVTDDSVTWSSSDELIATVDNTGLVTVLVEATTGETVTITATSVEDPTKSDTCVITVE